MRALNSEWHTWYWVSAGHACGAIIVDRDLDAIVDCAPIFRRRFIGRPFSEVVEAYGDELEIRRLRVQRARLFHTHTCGVRACRVKWWCEERECPARRMCARCKGVDN